MHSTTAKRNRNRGMRSCTLGLNSKNDSCSSRKVEKISKYFAKVEGKSTSINENVETKMATAECSSSSSDSPYKNRLKEIKCAKLSDSTSELDEFKTPVLITKVSKLVQSKQTKKTRRKKSHHRNQTSMRKFLEDNFKNSDVNADHLQLALALSESSCQAENPEEKSNSQEKLETFRKALEKYGFGYGKKGENNQDFYDITKKSNKKSRYRFITPVLKIRTPEERESLITSKVSLILAQNNRFRPLLRKPEDTSLFSEKLGKFKYSKIFKLNHLELQELNINIFYVDSLKLEITTTLPGYLLKNWKNIAGRETSPTRHPNSVSVEGSGSSCSPVIEQNFATNPTSPFKSENISSNDFENCTYAKSNEVDNNKTSFEEEKLSSVVCRSVSPDLFASDEEYEAIEQIKDKWEQCPLQNSLEVNIEEQECYDLTQSDNEEIQENLLDKKKTYENKNFSESKTEMVSTNPSFLQLEDLSQRSVFPKSMNMVDTIICLSDDDDHNETFQLKGEENKNFSETIGKSCSFSHNNSGYFGGDWMQYVDYRNNEKSYNNREEQSVSQKSFENFKESAHSPEKSVEKSLIKFNATRDENNLENFAVTITNTEKSNYYANQEWDSFIASRDEKPDESKTNQELHIISDKIHMENEEISFRNSEIKMISENSVENCDNSYNCDEYLVKNKNQYWENLTTADQKKYFEGSENPEAARKLEKISTSEDDSKLSQESITISDEELNYSCAFGTPGKENKEPILEDSFNDILNQTKIQNQLELAESQTEVTPNKNHTLNENFVIKTNSVTPMANYDEMDTPKIVKELDKFGIKPMKRQRGAKMLKYIYESTHPLVEDDDGKIVKKRKTSEFVHFEGIVGEIEEKEIIFERKPMKRGLSCKIPLHIVWHNFVMSNPQIRESILLYEPLHLEMLHSMLKDQGFRFNIQDLLRFLDQKCITFRTAQGGKGPTKHQKHF